MPTINLPTEIETALDGGATLAISISGGKDSQAMAIALGQLHRERGWTGELVAIHADLGRIEWPGTMAQVQAIADMAGARLIVVRRGDGRGMVEHWRARGEKLQADGSSAPFWSSSASRYCTSDLKRDPIDSALRRLGDNVVCAVGLRAQESDARAKQPVWERRKRIETRTRRAFTWHPILAWSLLDVLRTCGYTWAQLQDRRLAYAEGKTEQALDGWTMHPAYVFGNERLSCQFCVLGSINDLSNAARHNPELLEELIALEDRFGATFQNGRSLRTFRQAASSESAPQEAQLTGPPVRTVAPGEGKTEQLTITYLSGAVRPETLRGTALGSLFTPWMGNRPERVGIHAHDNGVFTEFLSHGAKPFSETRFVAHLEKFQADRALCLFAAAPDVVGDWEATKARSYPWFARIRALGYRAALVVQDGAERDIDRLPWDDFDVIFLGGGQSRKYLSKTNRVSVKTCKCPKQCKHARTWMGEWKLTPGAARLVKAARARGKDVHMGRVNSMKRLRAAQDMGCTSADGTFLKYGADKLLPEVRAWLEATAADHNPTSCVICRDRMARAYPHWSAARQAQHLVDYQQAHLDDPLVRNPHGGPRYRADIATPARIRASHELAQAA